MSSWPNATRTLLGFASVLATCACVHTHTLKLKEPPLPPAKASVVQRGQAIQPLAAAPLPEWMRGPGVLTITRAKPVGLFVHVHDSLGQLAHAYLGPGATSFQLVRGAATGDEPELFLAYADSGLLVRDLHDPSFELAPTQTYVGWPFMSQGPRGWGMIWSTYRERSSGETLMFVALDEARRVHPPQPLVFGRLDSMNKDIAGTPSGFAIAYLEELGPNRKERLNVLLLDATGELQRRVEIFTSAWHPQLATTSDGITVVYSVGPKLARIRLGFDGQLLGATQWLSVSGTLSDVVVHQNVVWLAVQRDYCHEHTYDQTCDDPPEAWVWRLASDATVAGIELVDEQSRGPITLASLGDRLVAAWIVAEPDVGPVSIQVVEIAD